MDKLKKAMRMNINGMHKKNKETYQRFVDEAQKVWLAAKEIIADNNFEVIMSESIRALYSLIETSQYRSIWYTEKTLKEAVQSMEGAREKDIDYDKEEVSHKSNVLVDYLQEAVGLSKQSKLSYLKKRIYNELVIEGKIR